MRISSPDRVVFPQTGHTKRDVADYYSSVSSLLLPFVANRALTVERFPKGLEGKGFMQKNAPSHAPPGVVATAEFPREEGGTTIYPVIDSTEGLLFFANLGVITFHAPPVRVDDLKHPDWLIWDLDPDEGDVSRVRRAAHALRDILEVFEVPTWPMTSGSKGYHLRAPIVPNIEAETASKMTRGISALAAATHPELMTLAFKKADRGGRVFVDWLRNTPFSTSAAPWSLRARPNASVAAPIAWSELEEIEPDGIDMGLALERSVADPWLGIEATDLSDLSSVVSAAVEEAGIELEPFDRFRS